ncbi:uncharacterized protein [Henckelia pumila]|uniref:uncharacterized protein n=1 Tax=Henckelia pumila TaxID=405737 RepID=UPI003C6E81E3
MSSDLVAASPSLSNANRDFNREFTAWNGTALSRLSLWVYSISLELQQWVSIGLRCPGESCTRCSSHNCFIQQIVYDSLDRRFAAVTSLMDWNNMPETSDFKWN